MTSSLILPVKDLLAGVELLNNIAPKKSAILSYSYILVEVKSDKVVLKATDGMSSVEYLIPIKETGSSPYQFAVLARTFCESLKTIKGKDNVELLFQPPSLKVISMSTSFYLPLLLDSLHIDLFPPTIEENIIRLEAHLLSRLFHQACFAASNERTNSILSGVLLYTEFDTLYSVATNSHRLAESRIKLNRPLEPAADKKAIIARKDIELMLKFIPKSAAEVEIAFLEHHFFLKCDNIRFSTRVLEGTFPKYKSLIVDVKPNIIVSKAEFFNVLKQVRAVLGDTNRLLKMRFTSSYLILEIDDLQYGSASGKVPYLQPLCLHANLPSQADAPAAFTKADLPLAKSVKTNEVDMRGMEGVVDIDNRDISRNIDDEGAEKQYMDEDLGDKIEAEAKGITANPSKAKDDNTPPLAHLSSIDAIANNGELLIGLNCHYMLDLQDRLDNTEMAMYVRSTSRPLFVYNNDYSSFLIMPIMQYD